MLSLIVVIVAISSTATASSAPNPAQPAWLALTKAYPERNGRVIDKYQYSRDKSIRLYAKALLDLSERDFSSLPKDGEACYKATPGNGADATAYFGCLWAVATGLHFAQRLKADYIWTAKVIAFYKRYSDIINKTTGSDNPAGIKALTVPRIAAIENWPDQKIAVEKKWSGIAMHNGVVTAYIDGKPIKVRVDTGDTGITLSKEDIKRYGLGSELVPLGVKSRTLDYTGGYMSNRYYVHSLRLGPILISNAYVSDAARTRPGPQSTIGINVLSALKRFTISVSKIAPFNFKRKLTCGRMMFTRSKVSNAVEYPFFDVPTSVASLGLFLDSGAQESGVFHGVGIYFSPKDKSELVNTDLIRPEKKNAMRVSRQNGKTLLSQTDIFNISISGIRTQGIFQRTGTYDPMVSGAMTFNFLKKAKVAYDFPDRKMCVIPDAHGTPTTSD
jgi:hypothetical protein